MLDRPANLANDAPFERHRPASALAALTGEVAGPASLGAVLSVLRRRRLTLILSSLLMPLLAWIALGEVTPRYTATASVLYEPNSYTLPELQSILRADPTTEAVMASQAEIVRGLRTAERVAERFGLDRDPEFNRALRPPGALAQLLESARRVAARDVPWLARRIGPPLSTDAEDAHHAVVLAVQAAIEVTTAKASRVMEIGFTAEDRKLAAAAANMVAGLYIQDQLDTKVDAVRRASRWLEHRVGELRREVLDAEDRIAAYRARQGMVQGVQAGLGTEQVSRLSTDVLAARDERARAEARLDAARGRAGAAAQAAIALSVAPLRAHRDQLAAQLQSLLARLGSGHPDVMALRSELAEADRSVGGEIARVVAASEADLRAATERVAALEQALAQARTGLEQSEQAQIPLNAIERDAEASRTLLQAVLGSIQQTAQQAAIETPDARVVSAAMAPVQPSFPRSGPLLAAAAAFGVLFGLLAVYLRELADATFRSGHDVRAVLGLPCFALIPEIGARALKRTRIEDFVAYKPLSPFAEQLRALRASLWFGAERPRVIAITAARPAEGKTTVAIALGRAAALSGERVVVLDCDIRQPSFGRLMRADGALGVVDCLMGHAKLEDVIRRDTLTSMDYVPAGAAETNSLGLLMSEAMGRIMEALRADYDLVLLDAPPAFAMADARVVARMADATLLCVRWCSSSRAVVRHSLELLEEAQARVAGVALTRVDVRTHARSGFADAEVYHPRYGGYFRE
jgi:capsular exopolysaccharide synthesis family protein